MESRNIMSFFENVFSCKFKEEMSTSKLTYETIEKNIQGQQSQGKREDDPRQKKN